MRCLVPKTCSQALAIALLTSTAAGRPYVVEVDPAIDIRKIHNSGSDCFKSSDIQLRFELESRIFNGFSIDVSGQDADLIRGCIESMRGVTNVWSTGTHLLLSQNPHATVNDPLQVAKDILRTNAMHEMTGVDQLHQQNITGRGVTVAIIDDGVDYLHPALGGGFGPGYKVRGGGDMVGDDWIWPGVPTPDDDPWVECAIHGTHVTGIVAGSDPSIGFVGVAPDAQILHYRIFGCTPSRYFNSDVVIKAILEAYEDGVDVISASISMSSGPFSDDPVSILMSRITEEGRTVCVASAGNKGGEGAFSADAPASAPGVLSVGYVDVGQLIESQPRARYRVTSGENSRGIRTYSQDPGGASRTTGKANEASAKLQRQLRVREQALSNVGTFSDFSWAPAGPGRFPEYLPLYALSMNTSVEGDGCQFVWPMTDMADKVVLVRRGGCPLPQKLQNVRDAGGSYVLIYNNVERDELFEFENTVKGIKGTGAISAKTGVELVALLTAGYNINMIMDSDFTLPPYLSARETEGGVIKAFSTWGASGEGKVLPSLVAPGGNIFSTLPRSWGGYGRLSGTSMSAPYAAGCVALIKQARPELTASEIVSLLVTTARPLAFSDGTDKIYDFLAPVWQQGGGLINPLKAIRTNTIPSSPSISFNDSQFFTGETFFTLKNTGHDELQYEVSSTAAASLLSLSVNSSTLLRFTKTESSLDTNPEFLDSLLEATEAAISVQSTTFTLAPKASIDVKIHADLKDISSLSGRCPLYGGYIVFNSSNGKSLSVPYGGIGCALKDVIVLTEHTTNGTFLASMSEAEISDVAFVAQRLTSPTIFTIPGPNTVVNSTDMKFPAVVLKLDFITRAVQINLLSASFPDNSAMGAAVFGSHVTTRPGGFNHYGKTHEFWNGKLADGSWAQEGEYKFRICAMRLWGSIDDAGAFRDCVTTIPFTLRYLTESSQIYS